MRSGGRKRANEKLNSPIPHIGTVWPSGRALTPPGPICGIGGLKLKNDMNAKNLWTVEWSESQQCFHVDTLDVVLLNNLGKFVNPTGCNDWSLIAILGSHKEASDAAELMREKRGIPTVFERFAKEHAE